MLHTDSCADNYCDVFVRSDFDFRDLYLLLLFFSFRTGIVRANTNQLTVLYYIVPPCALWFRSSVKQRGCTDEFLYLYERYQHCIYTGDVLVLCSAVHTHESKLTFLVLWWRLACTGSVRVLHFQ